MNRFVIGTGRCGSTLLTTMLAKHPDLLVLSEFFVTLDRKVVFSREPISGEDFAELIDREHFVVPPIRRRSIESRENLGDVPEALRVPALMVSTIPMNSDRPLELYGELLEAVAKFPVQPYRKHYDDLFDWLMLRTGKTCWVERSGPSGEYAPELVDMYPDGKFVFLHRSGPETAISMSHNPYFQLVASFFFDPPSREDLLATEYGGLEITGSDTLSRRLEPGYLALAKYGEYWTYEIAMCFKALAKLDAAQHIDIRYEDLISTPDAVMSRVAEFFELPERDGWIAEAASLIEGGVSTRSRQLPAAELQALSDACEMGELMLGRRKSPWIFPTLQTLEELAYQQFGRNA